MKIPSGRVMGWISESRVKNSDVREESQQFLVNKQQYVELIRVVRNFLNHSWKSSNDGLLIMKNPLPWKHSAPCLRCRDPNSKFVDVPRHLQAKQMTFEIASPSVQRKKALNAFRF
jgi:hypothetical protein